MRRIDIEMVEIDINNSSFLFNLTHDQVYFYAKGRLFCTNEELRCVCESDFAVHKRLFFAVKKLLLIFSDLDGKFHALFDSQADFVHFQ